MKSHSYQAVTYHSNHEAKGIFLQDIQGGNLADSIKKLFASPNIEGMYKQMCAKVKDDTSFQEWSESLVEGVAVSAIRTFAVKDLPRDQ